MLTIQKNIPLLPLNTFGMAVNAPFLSVIRTVADCAHIKAHIPNHLPILPLGGGSNILFTQDPQAWVLKNEIRGIHLLKEDDGSVWLEVGAGEVWNDFVQYCVQHDYAGVENLSLIPGTVGAAPIQNIGAYGVEVKQLIDTVTFWDFNKETLVTLDNAACLFGYRNSIFKHELKGQFLMTHVVFKLSKTPNFNISYGNIQEELDRMGITTLSLKAVSAAVVHIRESKLPNPKEIGNAGSFFKNPEVPHTIYQSLKDDYPTIPGYTISEQVTKIPAAWLIEQCGWKGFREGDFGVHQKQPLVLVNYAQAKGSDIFHLSTRIIASVQERFGISLEREVQIV
ncbi:UDP-N-acetylenolpyruvoylglucosamine reductase [Taibaiella sp. KBW10]|uniref:UDP-N-acetylmuramate dehydrogenase n=1 Tax=Taibaiella sp. KBW10 TaxID=2153357 RepID=UPI000F598CD2|nr:UDP-N-acetylmuramate dehydrogenase [Taibaiella sp. KBW10]RQO32533.1 UDP-N-acetylenolpyruvoylglucosamine reductase [Taibaiella sp. KBW10]